MPVSAAEPSAFRSPWWLPGRHLQTIVPALWAPRPTVRYIREQWETPDDDIIDVDRTVGDTSAGGDGSSGPRPTLVVFHGLEGSAQSRYVLGLMTAAAAIGWDGVAPHFRGCGTTPNRQPRFYHSGDSAEVDWVLRCVVDERARNVDTTSGAALVVAGISLGGNMLLKWLGEHGSDARRIVSAAAAISAPMDLAAGGAALGRGFNRLYARMFLKTLKAKSRAKLRSHPGLFDAAAMEAARDLHAFDDVVTAPLHGFDDADDYWRRASSKPLLRRIAVPTLILNARNDPFLPASALPGPDEVSPMVTREFPAHGGHVGFVAAGPDGDGWMPRRVVGFLAGHLAARSAAPAVAIPLIERRSL